MPGVKLTIHWSGRMRAYGCTVARSEIDLEEGITTALPGSLDILGGVIERHGRSR